MKGDSNLDIFIREPQHIWLDNYWTLSPARTKVFEKLALEVVNEVTSSKTNGWIIPKMMSNLEQVDLLLKIRPLFAIYVRFLECKYPKSPKKPGGFPGCSREMFLSSVLAGTEVRTQERGGEVRVPFVQLRYSGLGFVFFGGLVYQEKSPKKRTNTKSPVIQAVTFLGNGEFYILLKGKSLVTSNDRGYSLVTN